MSLRTFKARPKPNLDLTNKRRALTDDNKVNPPEEVSSKNEDVGSSALATTVPVIEKTNSVDADEKSSSVSSSSLPTVQAPQQNDEVTTVKTTKSCSSIPSAKLKPRPKPNLALGSRVNNNSIASSQRNSIKTQQDPEDCIIVAVSYPKDVSQENQINSSNNISSSVPAGDTVSSTTQQDNLQTQQRTNNITAKLKSRPKPNLLSLNRNKRPLPITEDSTQIAQNSSNNNNSAEPLKDSTSSQVSSTSEPQNDTIQSIQENIKPTENINSKIAKQENKTIVKKKKKKRKTKKKQIKLIFRRKLRSLIHALGYLRKIISKKKRQINFKRKTNLIKKKIKRMIKILKITKRKLKMFAAKNRKINEGKLYSKLWKIVIKEIERNRKCIIIKSKREIKENSVLLVKDNKKEICLDENMSGKANDVVDDGKLKENMKIDENEIVLSEKKRKINKIRCKINPVITKPSGVKSMRIKLFKDDGTSVKSSDMSSSDKQISKETKHISSSSSSSPSSAAASSSSNSKDAKNPTARRFNINTVKPNLATANRNYKPLQYTTSYGKLNNAVKQKFRDKFGSKKPPEHSKLTMLDLIFYNPSSNPMSEREKKKDTEVEITNEVEKQSVKTEEKLVNEEKESNKEDGNEAEEEDGDEDGRESSTAVVDTNGLPVPQLKITADGKVIIAPESLIVPGKNDEAIKNESRPLIVENDLTHHKVFNKKTKLEKKIWSFQETLKFYKVLNETGSDFLVMASHFPDRTRNCLKRKFKREEKQNGQLIDKVIGSRRIDFSEIEKELALNQMWDEVEKSCKRRSKYMPEIPDLNKGNISEMFLTKREREMKVTNGEDNSTTAGNVNNNNNGGGEAESNDANNKQVKQEKSRSKSKKKKKPKILRLKEYLADNGNGNAKKTFQINLKCLKDEPESANVSSDDDGDTAAAAGGRGGDVDNLGVGNIPIVVNTRIESSGISYTKSVTFNPNNMDLPVDVNETIAHTGDGDQQCPSSTEIIKEIVDILSTDEKPSILSSDEKLSTTAEDILDSDQSICID